MENVLKFFNPDSRPQLEEFFEHQKDNQYVEHFIDSTKDGNQLELKELIEYGLQFIPKESSVNFIDSELSSYFYLLSELDTLKSEIQDFVLDTMIFCEGLQEEGENYFEFDPWDIYENNIAPLLA